VETMFGIQIPHAIGEAVRLHAVNSTMISQVCISIFKMYETCTIIMSANQLTKPRGVLIFYFEIG
jgi:hypothetical protein